MHQLSNTFFSNFAKSIRQFTNFSNLKQRQHQNLAVQTQKRTHRFERKKPITSPKFYLTQVIVIVPPCLSSDHVNKVLELIQMVSSHSRRTNRRRAVITAAAMTAPIAAAMPNNTPTIAILKVKLD